MKLDLNYTQSNKLADFFFDVAKGVTLGVLGFSIGLQDVPLLVYLSKQKLKRKR